MEYDFSVIKKQLFEGELGILEQERIQYTGKFWSVFFITVIFALGMGFLAVIATVRNCSHTWLYYLLFVLICITGTGFLGVRHTRFKKSFRAKFKEQVIPFLAKKYDERLSYYPADGLIREYSESGIYPRNVDRYRAEDTFRGQFDLTAFSFGEIFTEYKTVTTNSKGQTSEQWHTIFKGILFVSDFHKHFSGETFVDADNMERIFGRVGRRFQKWNASRKGDLIKLENPEFENYFAVYSTNEQEGRYILTPSMMERMVNVRQKMNSLVSFSFRNNHMYVAVSKNEDFFEPVIYRTLFREKEYQVWWELLVTMSQIVEDLNLNTRIWTRE